MRNQLQCGFRFDPLTRPPPLRADRVRLSPHLVGKHDRVANRCNQPHSLGPAGNMAKSPQPVSFASAPGVPFPATRQRAERFGSAPPLPLWLLRRPRQLRDRLWPVHAASTRECYFTCAVGVEQTILRNTFTRADRFIRATDTPPTPSRTHLPRDRIGAATHLMPGSGTLPRDCKNVAVNRFMLRCTSSDG